MYKYNLAIRFQAVVQQRRDETAIWFDERTTVSYRALNAHANRIARLLASRGVVKTDVICMTGEKSLHTFAAMIACLKLGAIYCILDPATPVERLRKILNTCEPKLLLTERDFRERVSEVVSQTQIIEKGVEDFEAASFDDTDLPQSRSITGDDPAYIMFTSGSTGVPKGAVMTHGNVLNLIDWAAATYQITTDDRLTNVNALYFDNSVFDFYAALFNGARLVPFSKDEVSNPKTLVDKVDAARCTLWFSVPSLLIFLQTMRATDGRNLATIRRFAFGGEGYPKAKLKSLYDAYKHSAELFNVYGPTECTCICSSYKLSDADFADMQGLAPLGQIADNFSFLIIDEAGQPLPAGEIGELCLLGPNVGKGYYNDPERTAGSFVQNTGQHRYREIMYKTGDMVRFDTADGKLYIHGRRDNQIKHMGYRIELEEIEAALNRLHYVSEAAALHTNHNGLSRIVAVIAASDGFVEDELRRDLKQLIPSYMIPSVIHREETLPKNANGKVDRRSLAEKYLQPK